MFKMWNDMGERLKAKLANNTIVLDKSYIILPIE